MPFLTGYAHGDRSLSTVPGKAAKESVCDHLERYSCELDLIYHYINTGSRVTPVQRDSFSGWAYGRLPIRTSFIPALICPNDPYSCKDYIDHIYPSHHFW